MTPGSYRSGPGNVTYVIASRVTGKEYSTVENDASVICVEEAGSGPGARVSGTFAAQLEGPEGTNTVAVSGMFFGTIGGD